MDALEKTMTFISAQRPAAQLDVDQQAVAGILAILRSVKDKEEVLNAVRFYLGQENSGHKSQMDTRRPSSL